MPELTAATSDVHGAVAWSYDDVGVYVDGFHSGGPFLVLRPQDTATLTAQAKLDTNNVQAQEYLLVAEATGPRQITARSYLPAWALGPPYADGSGFRRPGLPSLSGYEIYMTPWDELRPEPSGTRTGDRLPGRRVGLRRRLRLGGLSGGARSVA